MYLICRQGDADKLVKARQVPVVSGVLSFLIFKMQDIIYEY